MPANEQPQETPVKPHSYLKRPIEAPVPEPVPANDYGDNISGSSRLGGEL